MSQPTPGENIEKLNIGTTILDAKIVPPSSQIEEDFDPSPTEKPKNIFDNSKPS